MDISSRSRVEPGQVRDLSQTQAVDQERRRARSANRYEGGSDEAVISDPGQLISKLSEAVRQAPDVREEKVAALKELIQSGGYNPSPADIAKAILGRG